MKVIVTGGAGYIGSHTIIELVSSKFTPIIIDNLCNSNISNINGIKKIGKKLNGITKIVVIKKICMIFLKLKKIFLVLYILQLINQ